MPHRPRWLCRTHSPIFPRSSLFGSPTAQSAQIWGGDALSGGHAPVQLAGRKVFKALYSDQILTDGRAAEIRMACSPKRVISFKWWRMETKLWETDLCPPTPLSHTSNDWSFKLSTLVTSIVTFLWSSIKVFAPLKFREIWWKNEVLWKYINVLMKALLKCTYTVCRFRLKCTQFVILWSC